MAISVIAGRPQAVRPPKPSRTTKSLANTTLVPAAARPPEVLSDDELLANVDAIELFAKAVGGRSALIDTLSVAETAPEVEKVINLLLDPRYRHISLKQLCAMASITVADLFAAYKKSLIVKAHVEATRIIASRLPPIVEDVMTRATPRSVVCGACAGTGQIRLDGQLQACPACQASGYVQSEPALDRQKLALELGQLTQKSGGLTIQNQQINQTSMASPGGGVLEQLQQAVGELLFPSAKPVIDLSPLPQAEET